MWGLDVLRYKDQQTLLDSEIRKSGGACEDLKQGINFAARTAARLSLPFYAHNHTDVYEVWTGAHCMNILKMHEKTLVNGKGNDSWLNELAAEVYHVIGEG